MIRGGLAVLAAPALALAILGGAYAAWLLGTEDPDGGRHPVGAMVLAGSALVALVSLWLLRRATRR